MTPTTAQRHWESRGVKTAPRPRSAPKPAAPKQEAGLLLAPAGDCLVKGQVERLRREICAEAAWLRKTASRFVHPEAQKILTDFAERLEVIVGKGKP